MESTKERTPLSSEERYIWRRRLKSKKMRQTTISGKLDPPVSPVTFNYWLSGKHIPSEEHIDQTRAILEIYAVDLSDEMSHTSNLLIVDIHDYIHDRLIEMKDMSLVEAIGVLNEYCKFRMRAGIDREAFDDGFEVDPDIGAPNIRKVLWKRKNNGGVLKDDFDDDFDEKAAENIRITQENMKKNNGAKEKA